MGSMYDTLKQYKNSENKWKKDLKALNNKNKILYSIANKYGLRRELKNINKIRAKSSKKICDSSIDSSSDDLDSDSALARDSI